MNKPKSINENDDNKSSSSGNDKSLKNKFKRLFILPLICGIFISLVMSVTILLLFSNNLADKKLGDKILELENEKNNPILITAKNILYKKFQKPIYTLNVLNEFYDFHANKLINTKYVINIEEIDKLIKSAKWIHDNYSKITTSNQYALWMYDGIKNNLNDFQKLKNDNEDNKIFSNFIKQIETIRKLIPIFKSIVQQSENIQSIYYASKKTELYLMFPILPGKQGVYDIYIDKDIINHHFKNEYYCKDNSGKTPKNYYFQCRSWWYQILDFIEKNPNNYKDDVLITHPYRFAENDLLGITICYIFDDIFTNDLSTLCFDINIADSIRALEHLNRILTGYMYILRVQSDIPLYYPTIDRVNNIHKLQYYEFNINESYYIEELTSFTTKTVYDLISNREITKETNHSEKVYYKNTTKFTYEIYPIDLHINQIKGHLIKLNLIYVSSPDRIKGKITLYQQYLYPRLIILICLFIVMGVILVLLAWFLISTIAMNIIKPIKYLKYLIYQSDENKSDELDEDILDIRSAEMEQLVDTFLKLKNVLNFTSQTRVIDNNVLIKYIYAKYTFKDVNKDEGVKVCDSNLGNHALKYNKYDKSIFHLMFSIELNNSLNFDFIYKDLEKYINEQGIIQLSKKLSFNEKKISNSELTMLLEKNNNSVIPVIKRDQKKIIYLESRYPKLIYSFKQFFNTIKKKFENTDDLVENDFYILKEKHTLNNFEKTLLNYIYESKLAGDNLRIAESLIEYLEFIVIYLLPHKKKGKDNFLFERIKKICDKFELFSSYLRKYNTSDYYKTILDRIINCKNESLDLNEVPQLILEQKYNYLKGKLAITCGHYDEAIKFFNISKKKNLISDARIIYKSTKKIIKILKILKTNHEEKDGSKNKKIDEIDKLIPNLNEYLSSFVNIYKDIIVLLDINMNENKNIDKAYNDIKQNFYDKYVCLKDRFSFFYYNQSVHLYISLNEKNIENHSFVTKMFNIYNIKSYTENNNESNIIKAIHTVNDYLTKKSICDIDREKWVVVYTNKFIPDHNFKDFKNKSLNIIIIGLDMKKSDIDNINIFLKNFGSKSKYIDFIEIQSLKNIFKGNKGIKKDYNFSNERYDNDKRKM